MAVLLSGDFTLIPNSSLCKISTKPVDEKQSLENVTEVREQLYNSVVRGALDNALKLTDSLKRNGNFQNIKDVVIRLLNIGTLHVLGYAYRLWLSNEQGLVIGYFPPAFKYIFNGDVVTITNNRFGLPMKLQVDKDNDGDRKAWGDGAKTVNDRMKWKFITSLENNTMYFKIVNEKYNQYLKLEIKTDNVGDRAAFGSDDDDTSRHQWLLRPAMDEGNLLFYIFNRKYNQALKMGDWQDNIKDRLVWGHNGQVQGQPAIFGWKIE